MKKLTGIGFGMFLACFACLYNPQATIAAIRVVAYNTCNNPDDVTEDAWFSTIFSAIGDELVNGMAKRLDILVVSETDTGSSARLVDILNNLYGVEAYTAVTSSSVGGDRTGVVYDESAVTLLDHNDLTSLGTHPILRAHFRPVGYTSPDSGFYVYAVHLTSGDSSSAKATRASEAANLRGNADALGEGKYIIYAGDFNLLDSSEGAWMNMLASGNAQAFDTANSPGEWRDNEAFKSLHSQDPGTAMDDRFDFQFVSGEFLDGSGLDYISDSFHVFANNGTHTLNDSIGTGSGASPTVLTALESASDHLPVMADYRASGPTISDAELLDETEALTANYFFEEALSNGLVKDADSRSYASIAATGFGLTAFTIMTERYGSSPNWTYTPEQLRERANQVLDTLIEIQDKQTVSESEYGKEGLFYHFIMPDGTCASGSEVSTVDTAILFAGVITAGEYYGGEVKQKSDQIVGKANWAYFLKTPQNDFPSNNGVYYQFSHGWEPNSGIFKQTWDRPTDEAILISVIALASSPGNMDFQKSLFSWPRVKRSYASYEVVNSYFGSLFTYIFGHVWIDFEAIGKDKPEGIMPGVEGVDWWQNSVNAAKAARQFVIDNADIHSSYGPDSWGLSAVEEPNGQYEGRYGALPTDSGTAFHDGTIAPYSSISTIALFKNEDGGDLTDNDGFRALRNFYNSHYWNLWGEYGPKDSFNSQTEFSETYLGIDQGSIVAMIENYRTRFVWEQFLKNERVKTALKNVFEFLIVGDFCGANFGPRDGYVDVWDLMDFADHWHTGEGDANWDSMFDLTGPNFGDPDGYVDVWDLMTFADHWHEGEPP